MVKGKFVISLSVSITTDPKIYPAQKAELPFVENNQQLFFLSGKCMTQLYSRF